MNRREVDGLFGYLRQVTDELAEIRADVKELLLERERRRARGALWRSIGVAIGSVIGTGAAATAIVAAVLRG